MTIKKIIAIICIYSFTVVAWIILATTNDSRTSSYFYELQQKVIGIYGDRVSIHSPELYKKNKKEREKSVDDKKVIEEYNEFYYYDTQKAKIDININLDQRKKGNLWFPTFKANFEGNYNFKINDYNPKQQYFLYTTLNSANSIYTDISIKINSEDLLNLTPLVQKKEILVMPDRNGFVNFEISYSLTGIESLVYYISHKTDAIVQMKEFDLKIKTDFDNFDFPPDMMSPLNKSKIKEGYLLEWGLKDAITGKDIGIIIPNKLNPGEIVTRVTFFAPISLLFFFIVTFMVSIILKLNIHPMNYFFLAATFFSFHLMYSYFSDHINIYITFVISTAISLFLTMSYLRLFTSKAMAYVYAPMTQFVYLIIFSFSFFLKGMTGFIVTIFAVLTLYLLMQLTGKLNWDNAFVKKN